MICRFQSVPLHTSTVIRSQPGGHHDDLILECSGFGVSSGILAATPTDAFTLTSCSVPLRNKIHYGPNDVYSPVVEFWKLFLYGLCWEERWFVPPLVF